MKKVELMEIEKLYKDCHAGETDAQSIRTTLNTGNMNNKLNCNYSFMNRNASSLKCSDTAKCALPGLSE